MPSLQSSNSVERRRKMLSLITWLIREITGAVFLFSGFVKAVDVWGTVYKFGEYFQAMGLEIPHNLVLAGAIALCGSEFLIGVFLILGCYRRSTPLFGVAFMCVMLPLSLWLAVADPVADCGCFGDAVKISNWATFWKNVILMACVLWLVKFNRSIFCIITPAFQWIAFTATGLYIVFIGWYGYMIQPPIDFRPFKVGTSLIPRDNGPAGPSYAFTYQKDGKQQEFTEDNLPEEDDGWEFVSRRELPYPEENHAEPSHDFRVMDRNGREDATEEAIPEEGKEMLLLIPSLKDISASTTYKINLLYEWAKAHGMVLSAVVAADSGDIAEWEDLSMPRYDIYTADDTSIKELARGNPAVVYINSGIIRWKSTLLALNDDLFAEPDNKTDVNAMAPDTLRMLKNISLIYLAVMAMLICISFIPRLARVFRPLGSKRHVTEDTVRLSRGDKAHHAESSLPDKSAPQKIDGPSHD